MVRLIARKVIRKQSDICGDCADYNERRATMVVKNKEVSWGDCTSEFSNREFVLSTTEKCDRFTGIVLNNEVG